MSGEGSGKEKGKRAGEERERRGGVRRGDANAATMIRGIECTAWGRGVIFRMRNAWTGDLKMEEIFFPLMFFTFPIKVDIHHHGPSIIKSGDKTRLVESVRVCV